MKKEDGLFLKQLINSLSEHYEKLEKSYIKKDAGSLDATKKTMMKIQQGISEILK
jgi:hypothetical protein